MNSDQKNANLVRVISEHFSEPIISDGHREVPVGERGSHLLQELHSILEK